MGSTHTMSRNNGTSESKYHFVVLVIVPLLPPFTDPRDGIAYDS